MFTYSTNKAKYDSLSPAQKKIIDGHCTTGWAVNISRPWTDFEAAGRGKKKALAGHETYSLTPEQVKACNEEFLPVLRAGRNLSVEVEQAHPERL